ncbi:hypothetical protein LAM21_23605, partial [Mycobacterium tuberculosis]|nr:hypothetical protein [Mycobacterium tuberculosis]
MRKIIISFLLISVFLVGCGTPEPEIPVGTIVEAKVVGKEEEVHVRASNEYFITIEKNEQRVKFEVGEEVYSIVSEGVIISG